MTSLTGFFSHSVRDPVPISLAEKCRLCFCKIAFVPPSDSCGDAQRPLVYFSVST